MVAPIAPSGPAQDARRYRASAWGRRAGGAGIALALLGGTYAIVLAQVGGDRGIAPTAASADIEVRDIEVDVLADSGEEAREEAWQTAQREAWKKIDGPPLSDGQLTSMVSSIVIQKERIGPKRYVATLGVVFDRQRAGRYLGGLEQTSSSAPMMLIPVTASAGTYTVFETRNPWQRAWAEFNPGRSRIDYVRPTGSGGDSLLITYGQSNRRSRAWWNSTLDQYGAADVLIPIARLDYQFPGGPVKGTFTARYGPDSKVLESFELEAQSGAELPQMLATAVGRMDGIFQKALESGLLRPDPTLQLGGSGAIDPAIQRLIEIGRAMREREAAAAAAPVAGPSGDEPAAADTSAVVRSFTVQFASPDAQAFDAALSGVRGASGVRGVAVTSTAMGGTSVMNVTFAGTIEELAAALRSRGFNVNQGAGALSISR